MLDFVVIKYFSFQRIGTAYFPRYNIGALISRNDPTYNLYGNWHDKLAFCALVKIFFISNDLSVRSLHFSITGNLAFV